MIPANDREFSVTRRYPAPVDLLFRLWTDPRYVHLWWGVDNASNPVCELDVRPGGAWRIDMRTGSGKTYHNHGTYLEVIENQRLVYSDIPFPGLAEWQGKPPRPFVHTVTFHDHDDTCEVTLTVRMETTEDRDRMVALGMPRGWSQSFDRLGQIITPNHSKKESLMSGTPHAPSGIVTARDGTAIAYDRIGSGKPLILVTGSFNDRHTGAALAQALSDAFCVYTYDRRGRGDSGDVQPYAVEREIEDIAALIDVAGGSAHLFGFSAGAVLALRAAASGLPIPRLVLFGTPLITDDSRPPVPENAADHIQGLINAGQRGEAVELFQREVVGLPDAVVQSLRHAPFRPALEAMAHTLVYDILVTQGAPVPMDLLAAVVPETLVVTGDDGPPWISHSGKVIAAGLPRATHLPIAGLTQDMKTEKLEGPVRAFLGS